MSEDDFLRHQRMADLAPYLIILVDADAVICRTNDTVEQILGHDARQLAGTSFLQLIAEKDRTLTESLMRETMPNGPSRTVENQCGHADGSWVNLKMDHSA